MLQNQRLCLVFHLYGINFYDEALENLNRFLKLYPSDKNVMYAHYLISIIYFEQITDEKKDLEPLLKANEKIDFLLKDILILIMQLI